jgi:hypothetical protein
MTAVLSKTAYARHRGVETSAVSKWIARGKLFGGALTADGQIAVEEADRQLAATIDPGRGAPGRPSIEVDGGGPSQKAGDAVPASLARVRLRTETLKLEELERKAALEQAELMRTDEAARVWGAELDDLLAAVELFVLKLPVELGLGQEGVVIAQREWREFRRRRADQARQAHAA